MNTERTVWPPEGNGESPFNPLTQYDRIIGEQCRENKTWRTIAVISMAAFFASLGVVLYALSLPQTVPLVITVSDFGEATYRGAVKHTSYTGMDVPEIAIQYQLRKFVTNLYTIPVDAEVLRNNLTDCYSCLTGTTSEKLSNRLRLDNPFNQFGSVTQRVEIESVLLVSGKTYQIDFILSNGRPNDSQIKKTRVRGALTVELLNPPDEDRVANPLGIYIAGFDFTVIGGVS